MAWVAHSYHPESAFAQVSTASLAVPDPQPQAFVTGLGSLERSPGAPIADLKAPAAHTECPVVATDANTASESAANCTVYLSSLDPAYLARLFQTASAKERDQFSFHSVCSCWLSFFL